MNQNNIQALSRQLQAVASAMPQLPPEELIPTVLDCCNVLLSQSQKLSGSVTEMDPMTREELLFAYNAISQRVVDFTDAVREQEDLAGIRQLHAGAMEQLRQALDNKAKMKKEIADSQKHIKELEQDTAGLKTETDAARQKLEELQSYHNTLTALAAEYSEEVQEKQRQENESLEQTVAENRSKLKKLEEDRDVLNQECRELQDNILQVEAQIGLLPQSRQTLLDEYDEKVRRLERLENIQVECSPDKQRELEEKIREMEPAAQKLEQDTEKLRGYLERLQDKHSYLDRENQTLQTEILAYVQGAMDELAQLMEEHHGALQAAKTRCQTLTDNLEQCRKLRQEYEAWFCANSTPLDAMLRALDTSEHDQLRSTLDLTQCGQIRKLYDQIREDLTQLDEILRRCTEAVYADGKELERLVK